MGKDGPTGIMFDAGPIINLTLNNMLWLLPRLKHLSETRFYITRGVKEELIDKPLQTRKYKFEALQILPYLNDGTLEVLDSPQIRDLAQKLDTLINSVMKIHDTSVTLVHKGELTAMAACLLHDLDALAIDERTTRYLIETPSRLQQRMERKLHTQVILDKERMHQVTAMIGGIRCVRSVELVSVAYAEGLFCHYTYQTPSHFIPAIEDKLLEGLLWGLKLNGCAITEEEVAVMYTIIRKARKACRIA